MKITIGTRGSNLAVIQTNSIAEAIQEKYPDVEVEIKIIKTKGDIFLDTPLHKLNDKGLFVKEIENELLSGEIDLAVHSMKDMPSEMTEGLVFAKPPKSHDPADVLVLRNPISSLSELKNGRIGTGSKRRTYQLERLIENIEVVPIRGNIETRMSKIESENLDAVILAKAGLERASHQDRIGYVLDPKIFLPSPCQGILALQYNEKNIEVGEILNSLSDENTLYRYETERMYQKTIGAGCHSPVGIYTEIKDDNIVIYGMYGDEDGSRLIFKEISGPLGDRLSLSEKLANSIKEELDNE
ncbi:MAG: hydroxymethylbilane synthase [Tissierellia bacterium]|nr:hydroxymethylbilane synthase [Tissierellia bacterium]